MRSFLILTFLITLTTLSKAQKSGAQKIDSIFFNLYTDSLKKGTYNYINVDGKLSDGRWLPLTAKEINFSASSGTFSGNSLFIDSAFNLPKVTIKAALKENPSIFKEITIYIKTTFIDEKLKTAEELMEEWKNRGKEEKKKKKTKDTTQTRSGITGNPL
ncbi:MAG TPA: hypothetical protein VGD17_19985 [Chitinophagaceae bacterium]